MAYPPTSYVDGVTPVNAANLNKAELGLSKVPYGPDFSNGRIPVWNGSAWSNQFIFDGQIAPTAAIAISKLKDYPADGTKVLKGDGTWAVPAAGGADLSYDGDWAAGTYQDGDVVVKDGIAYLCVGGPTTEAPSISPWGQAALSVLGEELGYAQITANVTLPSTSGQATGIDVVTAPGIAFDGSTTCIVEFAAANMETTATAILNLLMDGVDQGVISQSRSGAGTGGVPVSGRMRLTPPAGTHVFKVRGWGSGAAATVYAGTPYLPAFIRITKILPSPPSYGAGALTPVTYGTTLPVAPADGQEAILVDSLTAPTYAMRFRYSTEITDAYKWVYVGGGPVLSFVPTQENTASTTYVALPTAQVITLPRPGIYDIEISYIGANANGGGVMSYLIDAIVASDLDGAWHMVTGTGGAQEPGVTIQRKTFAAASTLTARFRATNGTAHFRARTFKATPVRVS